MQIVSELVDRLEDEQSNESQPKNFNMVFHAEGTAVDV